eukprot:4457322-Amphidinium_carterae.3
MHEGTRKADLPGCCVFVATARHGTRQRCAEWLALDCCKCHYAGGCGVEALTQESSSCLFIGTQQHNGRFSECS